MPRKRGRILNGLETWLPEPAPVDEEQPSNSDTNDTTAEEKVVTRQTITGEGDHPLASEPQTLSVAPHNVPLGDTPPAGNEADGSNDDDDDDDNNEEEVPELFAPDDESQIKQSQHDTHRSTTMTFNPQFEAETGHHDLEIIGHEIDAARPRDSSQARELAKRIRAALPVKAPTMPQVSPGSTRLLHGPSPLRHVCLVDDAEQEEEEYVDPLGAQQEAQRKAAAETLEKMEKMLIARARIRAEQERRARAKLKIAKKSMP